MQGCKWLANPTFGYTSATFTWHVTPHSLKRDKKFYHLLCCFSLVRIQRVMKELLLYSFGTNYWVALLCILQITIINMSTEIFYQQSFQLKTVRQNQKQCKWLYNFARSIKEIFHNHSQTAGAKKIMWLLQPFRGTCQRE